MRNLGARPAFVYDSRCDICAKFKRVVSFLDANRKIEFVPIEEAESKGLLDSIPFNERFRSSHFVTINGKILSGGDGVVELIRYLPGGRVLAYLIRLTPSGIRTARLFYDILSKFHKDVSCSGKC